ncbi:MAG: hypothetical protein L0Y56_10650 [Nitrospira sp.]|nr:hypothetical protein [Nitrospira sp.]
MKKVLGLLGCLLLVVAFSGVGLAGEEMGAKGGNVTGEVVKISGEMVDVKDGTGKVHSIHVDPKSTKKTGELKVGAKVMADVNDMGHANSISVQENKK